MKKIFILLIIVIGSFGCVFSETNGVWHLTQDIRPGTFGSDEISGDYSFMNSNVGIGTSNPNALLHVKGNSHTFIKVESPSNSYASYITFFESGIKKWSVGQNPKWSVGSNDFYIYNNDSWSGSGTKIKGLVIKSNNGKVGIGTNDPSSGLEVVGGLELHHPSNYSSIRADSDSTYLTICGGKDKWDNPKIKLYSWANDKIYYEARDHIFKSVDTKTGSGNELMIIKDNGNVGIGTTTPTVKLEVNGDVKGDSFCFNSGGCLSVQ